MADDGNQTIRKITPAGVVSVFAGATGTAGAVDGLGAVARFTYPYGLAVDSSNNVYVADSGNRTVRKITPDGLVTTLAGRPAWLGMLMGLARKFSLQRRLGWPWTRMEISI